MKRIMAPLLTVLLILGVGAALYLSISEQSAIEVRGLIGSEKEEFFRDPRVIEALGEKGHSRDLRQGGSREIATKFNLKEYDLPFPQGCPDASLGPIVKGTVAKCGAQ